MASSDLTQAIMDVVAAAVAEGRHLDIVATATAIHADHSDAAATLDEVIDELFFEYMRRLLWS